MMSPRSNLERLRSLDIAWNERRWSDYGAILSDRMIAFVSGEAEAHGKSIHVSRAKAFCRSFPDACVHIDPYVQVFANPDGSRTCTVARLTGTAAANPSLQFDITFSVVCIWQDGRIINQHQFVDDSLLDRQLGRNWIAQVTH